VKQDEIGMGIADARLRVRRQGKAFIREETNRSVLSRESSGERKGTRAGRKGQRNFGMALVLVFRLPCAKRYLRYCSLTSFQEMESEWPRTILIPWRAMEEPSASALA